MVPPLVLLSAIKAPRIVALALMLNWAFAAELSTDPPEIVPGVNAGRVALEYAVDSAHPVWDAIVSPAT